MNVLIIYVLGILKLAVIIIIIIITFYGSGMALLYLRV